MSSLQSERALYADNEAKLDEERDTFVSPKLFQYLKINKFKISFKDNMKTLQFNYKCLE